MRQNLEKWLSPPDPSVNYNAASEAHPGLEGTAVWFIETTAFTDWKASGPLLWIYGKRNFSLSLRLQACLRSSASIAGSGKSVLRLVPSQTHRDSCY